MKKNRIIGICGGSASGKTSISKKIGNMYENDITLLSQDSYYKSYDELTLDQKKKINYDHPDSFDIDLLVHDLNELKNNYPIESPIYSFNDYCRKKDRLPISPHNIIIIEGMLVLYYPELRKLLDYSVFIDVCDSIRLKRMIQRDIAERGRTTLQVLNQYMRDMKPMHDEFVEPQKKHASVIIDGNDSMDIVYSRVVECINTVFLLTNANNVEEKKLIKRLF